MYTGHGKILAAAGFLVAATLLAGAPQAFAVPSYARQTGLTCDTCHTVAPQLTPFGRYFKLNGYTLSTTELKTAEKNGTAPLKISKFPPLSAMVRIAHTSMRKAKPGALNSADTLPSELALYYAGEIMPHMGSFIQATYDSIDDKFTMDMTDLRYARTATVAGIPVVWGIDANNQPTFSDIFNSTPAGGFPYVGSDSALTPDAAPMIEQLAQQVAGAGMYAWFDNAFYADFQVYRSFQLGTDRPLNGNNNAVISSPAPYWRIAWQHNWNSNLNTSSFEIGALGMNTHLYPGNPHPLAGPTDRYNDIGIDSQYQLLFENHSSLAVHALYIHESQKLDASFAYGDASKVDNHLNTWQVDAQYYWHEITGPSLAYFHSDGSQDALLYDSRTHTPDSSGWIVQWTYLPAQNVQLAAQYTLYNKFNGASSNYDGNGRDASDNNTLYLSAWILW